jgi:hypothetical protein
MRRAIKTRLQAPWFHPASRSKTRQGWGCRSICESFLTFPPRRTIFLSLFPPGAVLARRRWMRKSAAPALRSSQLRGPGGLGSPSARIVDALPWMAGMEAPAPAGKACRIGNLALRTGEGTAPFRAMSAGSRKRGPEVPKNAASERRKASREASRFASGIP